MNESNFLVGAITSGVLALFLTVSVCSIHDTNKAAEMIKAGADPVKVGCMFNTAKCVYVK